MVSPRWQTGLDGKESQENKNDQLSHGLLLGVLGARGKQQLVSSALSQVPMVQVLSTEAKPTGYRQAARLALLPRTLTESTPLQDCKPRKATQSTRLFQLAEAARAGLSKLALVRIRPAIANTQL